MQTLVFKLMWFSQPCSGRAWQVLFQVLLVPELAQVLSHSPGFLGALGLKQESWPLSLFGFLWTLHRFSSCKDSVQFSIGSLGLLKWFWPQTRVLAINLSCKGGFGLKQESLPLAFLAPVTLGYFLNTQVYSQVFGLQSDLADSLKLRGAFRYSLALSGWLGQLSGILSIGIFSTGTLTCIYVDSRAQALS